ncbi:MAG: ATP synthase F1 subunit gamma [Chthonomonas sp.]|nr:ATP synthase F1 subunit gamma [Chthonomonas sp.]
MATLKEIRQRIRSAKNIRQITRAMKLVAAARLKKAQDRVLESRPYADKLHEFMASISSAGSLPSHELLEKRPVKRVGLILITAERGLAGGYNTNLIRKAADFVKNSQHPIDLLSVGKKGGQFFGKRGVNVVFNYALPTSGAKTTCADTVVKKAVEMFTTGEVDAIYVIYSKFYSAIRQVPTVMQLLPIEPPAQEGKAASKEYEFEPSPEGLLQTLLPRYVFTLTFQALLEATASEHGARMSAMTAATDNAGKMINDLTLVANRERQAAITTQILEVVGGAEALKG